ncbi:hypothetical protein [Legionella shakespearei]|uniref:Uncharacterized protein n=1 Tax=Legionella shakespearei DSM 23087 TaxID=1122169 RepID=A0A0W0YZV6_9GAMM|nr:hypothetical protein [Legionella shakespearei]KTD62412.1 hypothetical protein Lsha_1112 [Legionella shakespearei DSM 23087]
MLAEFKRYFTERTYNRYKNEAASEKQQTERSIKESLIVLEANKEKSYDTDS